MFGTRIRAVAVISIVPWLLLVATSCSTSSSPPAQTPTTSATARLSAAPAPGAIKPTVVLVHGAWADTSSWDGEYDALTKQGYDVRAIANPLESLDRIHTHLQRLRQIAKRRPPRMQQTVSEHLAICAAIHDGDETAAAQATALHIINSLHNILAVMTDDVIGRTTFATPTTADGHEQETRCDTR